MFDKRKADQWMRRQLFAEHDDGPVRKITLKHLQTNKQAGGEIHSMPVPKKSTEYEEWISTALTEFELSAEGDAEGTGGIQSYVLLSYRGTREDTKAASSRFPFRHTSERDDEEGSMSSEPATKAGSLSQQMRHNEMIMRTAMLGSGQVIQQQAAMLDRVNTMIEKLFEDKMESINAVQEALDLKSERDLKTAESAHRMQLQGATFEKLALLAPALVTKFTGMPMLGTGNPMMAGLKAFMDSLTPDQLNGILATLGPEQQIAILSIVQGVAKTDESASPNGTNKVQ